MVDIPQIDLQPPFFSLNQNHILLIYGIALAGNVVCWRHWQNRGVENEDVEDTSEYGRPLIKEGVGI